MPDYKKSLKKLREQLNCQILTDGGHAERSAAYHLLLLEKLIELSFLITTSFRLHKLIN